VGEAVLALAGLTFAAQGLGLTHSVRSAMNDRPEWVAIGAGMLVLALVLLWRTARRRAPA
jgi:MYXO-CTERM domain-containing protein